MYPFSLQTPLPSRLPHKQSSPCYALGPCWLSILNIAVCRCPSLEKAMAPHSSTLAWKIPWTEEPGGLQSMGSHRVGHDWSDLAAAAADVHPKLLNYPFPLSFPLHPQGNHKFILQVCESLSVLQVSSFVFLFRVCIECMSFAIFPPLSGLLHSAWQSLDPCMLLQMTLFHSF